MLLGFDFFETSAKDNTNVSAAFDRYKKLREKICTTYFEKLTDKFLRLVDVICEKMAETLEETAQQATPGTQNLHQNQNQQQTSPPCGC